LNSLNKKNSVGSTTHALANKRNNHTRGNSLSTAQFVNDDVAEYYFSGPRSLDADVIEEVINETSNSVLGSQIPANTTNDNIESRLSQFNNVDLPR
jgi:hypothetical protein